MNTNCQPPDCPCFCPSAALPLAVTLVPEGGPGAVIQVPIFGTQPFQVSIETNPLFPIAQVPLIASVQVVGGNTLLITTGIPDPNETLGNYSATLRICNPCGELIINVPIEVVADLTPVVSDCMLAQGVWTFENRIPTVGDTVLAFTPAGCRALLPPGAFDICMALQSFLPAVPAPVDTVFGNQGGACVQFSVANIVAPASVCAALNALGPLGPLAPTDQFVILRAGGCALATLTDVSVGFDICTALQNLPNAVVQPTAVFYGQQGGNCFEFAVADLMGIVGLVPILGANGSCAAPTYSFTASPDSGMFYTGSAVRIGDDNCTDFIEVGASINLQAGPNPATLSLGVLGISAISGLGGSLFIDAGAVLSGPLFANIVSSGLIQVLGGSVRVAAQLVTLEGGSGDVVFNTNAIDQLRIRNAGDWEINTNPGIAGQVITSQGVGLPPVWGATGAAFPLLAPNGSCAAPSYSFTASPDSGMFYTGTAVRISDDSCVDFIEVGTSINVQSAGAVSVLGSSLQLTSNVTSITLASQTTITLQAIQPLGTITIQCGSGGLVNITSPAAAGFDAGNVVIQPGSSATFGLAAGGVSILGGARNGPFIGGGFVEMRGGSTNDAGNQGGTASVSGGAGVGLGNGGAALFSGGGATGAGTGADALILGGSSVGGTAGRVLLLGGTSSGGTPGHVAVHTGDLQVERVAWLSGGEWSIGGTAGVAGQVITSQGAGLPSVWAVGSVPLNQVQDATGSAVRDHGLNAIDWAFDFEGANRFIMRDNGTAEPRFVIGPFSQLAGRRGDGQVSLFARDAAGTIQAQVTATSHITQPSAFMTAVVGVTSATVEVRTTGITLVTNGANGIIHNSANHTFRNASLEEQFVIGAGLGVFAVGNFLRVQRAASGSSPTMFAMGNPDANVDITLMPKGTGSVLAPILEIQTDNGYRASGQTNAAGVSVGTLNNAPSAGDPAFWLRVVINGANRFIPVWA